MTDRTRVDSARFALVTAVVLVVLGLGVRWGNVPGYRTIARVYLSAAAAGIAVALATQRTNPRLAARGVTVALASLVVMVGLRLRVMPTVPLLTTAAAIVLLLSVRLTPRRP